MCGIIGALSFRYSAFEYCSVITRMHRGSNAATGVGPRNGKFQIDEFTKPLISLVSKLSFDSAVPV